MSFKEEFLQNCLVLDTETNSDDYRIAEIIESGFVIRKNSVWQIFDELHRPENVIPPTVQSICYITNNMVADKQPFTKHCDVFQEVVNKYANGYLVAHNYFFDMKVLSNHGIKFDSVKWLCTWRMAKKLFADIPSIESTSLPYLRFALDLDIPIDMICHRAGNDSFITGKLLEQLVTLAEDSGVIDTSQPYGPQLYDWINQPIIFTRMPFGKHKGTLMTEIPVSYWQWAVNNTTWFDDTAENHDPDLAASIKHALLSINAI